MQASCCGRRSRLGSKLGPRMRLRMRIARAPLGAGATALQVGTTTSGPATVDARRPSPGRQRTTRAAENLARLGPSQRLGRSASLPQERLWDPEFIDDSPTCDICMRLIQHDQALCPVAECPCMQTVLCFGCAADLHVSRRCAGTCSTGIEPPLDRPCTRPSEATALVYPGRRPPESGASFYAQRPTHSAAGGQPQVRPPCTADPFMHAYVDAFRRAAGREMVARDLLLRLPGPGGRLTCRCP